MPPSPFASHWALDPSIDYLNHGAFGACPKPVLQGQQRWRDELEREPMQFLDRKLWGLLDETRSTLAAFVGADAEGLAFVPNATTAVNTVLASYPLQAGEEVLTTDHAYPACRRALQLTAERAQAKLVVVSLPYPVEDAEQWRQAVLDAVTPRTRLAMLDHVTSPSGLILPLESLVPELHARKIDVLIDGAHAPGMVEVDITALGCAFYAGNCHKWLCAPKGSGFLYVRSDWRSRLRPLVTSHGTLMMRPGKSAFHLEFDWAGTGDPSPYLCVSSAIAFMGSLLPGGWGALRAHNRQMALQARRTLNGALDSAPLAPETMVAALATVALPPDAESAACPAVDPLQARLFDEYRIEVPVFRFPAWPKRLLRASAQLYNAPEQYERLAQILASTK